VGNENGSRASLLRRLGAGLVSSAAGAVLLTGCAAGQQAQTVEQTPSIDGVQAEAGNIAIRAAGIASPESGTSYPKGATAQLRMVLINRANQPDKLVSVSSPVASEVQLSAASVAAGSSGGIASGSSPSASVPASSASATGPASTSAASSSTAGATSTPSVGASGSAGGSAASTPIDLPGRQSVQIGIGSGGPTVTLAGLTQELFPSQPVPVTFTFQSGASVTFTMAVQLSSEVPTAPTVSSATEAPGD
jgi:copper(I)-binding protein